MSSSGDGLGWRMVENTVTSRMVDLSLVHTLIPCKRLRRRTKALNAKLQKVPIANSYSLYIEAKNSVLQNFSEDCDTDDSDIFSDEDYTIVYKSDVSLKSYRTHVSRRNARLSRQPAPDVDENNVATKTAKCKTQKMRTRKSKNRNIRSVNLGWQSVKRKRLASVKARGTASRQGHDNGVSSTNEEATSNWRYVALEKVEPARLQPELGTAPCDNTTPDEPKAASPLRDDVTEWEDVTDLAMEGKGELESVVIEERDACEHGTSDLPKNEEEDATFTRSTTEEDPKDSLEERETANDKVSLDKEQPSILSVKPIDWSTPMSTKKRKNFVENLVESISTGNQPKDSGIDEDSQEDSSEDKQFVDPKDAIETIDRIHEDAVGAEISSVVEWPSTESLAPSETNVPAAPLEEREENKAPKHKLQPKVTHTEIVNKKYKIILGEELHDDPINTREGTIEGRNDSFEENESEPVVKSPIDSTKYSTDSKNEEEMAEDGSAEEETDEEEHDEETHEEEHDEETHEEEHDEETHEEEHEEEHDEETHEEEHDEETHEEEHDEEHDEESMSAFTKRRLQQLRRLNLTGDSSSTEEETIVPVRNSRLRRHFDTDMESSDEAPTNIEDSVSQACPKRPQRDTRESEDSKDGGNETLTHRPPEKSDFTGDKMSSGAASKVKKRSRDKFRKSELSVDEWDCEKKTTVVSPLAGETTVGRDEGGLRNGTTVSSDNLNSSTAVRKRPYNLQELIEHDQLTETTSLPSILLKDIRLEEHDAFILDIPTSVLDARLIGERITLTKKKFIIGREKYKIFDKSVDSLSFVFATGKSRRPYRTVNVKPLAAIVAGKKLRGSTSIKGARDTTVKIDRPPKRKRAERDRLALPGEKVESQNRKKRKVKEIQEDVGD